MELEKSFKLSCFTRRQNIFGSRESTLYNNIKTFLKRYGPVEERKLGYGQTPASDRIQWHVLSSLRKVHLPEDRILSPGECFSYSIPPVIVLYHKSRHLNWKYIFLRKNTYSLLAKKIFNSENTHLGLISCTFKEEVAVNPLFIFTLFMYSSIYFS